MFYFTCDRSFRPSTHRRCDSLVELSYIGVLTHRVVCTEFRNQWLPTVHTTDTTLLDFVLVGKFVRICRDCHQLVANSIHTAVATQLNSCITLASAVCIELCPPSLPQMFLFSLQCRQLLDLISIILLCYTCWWRSIVVRPPVLAGELSLTCTRLTAGHVTTS